MPEVQRAETDFDVVVIGSGFGGSVTALRLTEKGYRVAVLEAGRRFEDDEFAKTSWDVRRFLYAPRPKDGKIVLDFNKTYNPPCAFTPFATCPLPPKGNFLPFPLRAGEKKYSGPGGH